MARQDKTFTFYKSTRANSTREHLLCNCFLNSTLFCLRVCTSPQDTPDTRVHVPQMISSIIDAGSFLLRCRINGIYGTIDVIIQPTTKRGTTRQPTQPQHHVVTRKTTRGIGQRTH